MLRVEEITKMVEGIDEQFNDTVLIQFYDNKEAICVCEFIPARYYRNPTPIIEIVQRYEKIRPLDFTFHKQSNKVITLKFGLVNGCD